MERLRKAERVLLAVESALLVALLSAMIALAFLQVALRQILHTGFIWGDTLARNLVLWVGFLGAAIAAADQKHFAFEVAAHGGGGKGTAVMKLLGNLIAAAVSALLAKAAWQFFLDEKTAGDVLVTIGSVAVKDWLVAAAIPVGFALVGLHCLMRAAEAGEALGK